MTRTELRKHIGDRVRLLRLERRISQADLAKAIGISAPNLSCIETYKTSISVEILLAISKHLNVKPTDILPPQS